MSASNEDFQAPPPPPMPAAEPPAPRPVKLRPVAIALAAIGVIVLLGGILKFIPGGIGTGLALFVAGLITFGLSFIPLPVPREPEDPLPFFEKVTGIFYEPARVFRNLRAHPHWFGACAVVDLFVCVCAANHAGAHSRSHGRKGCRDGTTVHATAGCDRKDEDRSTISAQESDRTRSGNGQVSARSASHRRDWGRAGDAFRAGVWRPDQLLAVVGCDLLRVAAGRGYSEGTRRPDHIPEISGRLTSNSQPGHYAPGQPQRADRAGGSSGALRCAELHRSDVVLLSLAASERFALRRQQGEQRRRLGRVDHSLHSVDAVRRRLDSAVPRICIVAMK